MILYTCPDCSGFGNDHMPWCRTYLAPMAERADTFQAPASSRQEGGSHYTDLKIQPFEYSMKNGLDPMQHTVIKYVTRFRAKNGVEDLRKALHTLEMLIEYEESLA